MKFSPDFCSAFAACATSSVQYPTKVHAVSALSRVLSEHGLEFASYWQIPGDADGRSMAEVVDQEDQFVGLVMFCWYRTRSGAYEVVGQLT